MYREKKIQMIYPRNFETKIGFNEVRQLLHDHCQSALGHEEVQAISFSSDVSVVRQQLEQTREYLRLTEEHDDYALGSFFDCRAALHRIRIQGTHIEQEELFNLRRTLATVIVLVRFLNLNDADEDDGPDHEPTYYYPELHALTEGIITFPSLIKRIDEILDETGEIRDSASPELLSIRQELARTEGSISKTLYSILKSAQKDGLVDRDVSPTLRDGRLVIPVAPGLKRKMQGIIHDESASGRTVFIEPSEVVEANNRIRELKSQEHHEIIRILTEFTKQMRPHALEMLLSYGLLAKIDLIQSKAYVARQMKAVVPAVGESPVIDWIHAFHPLLASALRKQGKEVVPLDITLSSDKHILIVSGPNAGGKSVCLKTVGLLQYMLQCGLPIPVDDRSRCGLFEDIMIDIGDEQSIENDLSTYSSHLMNMKNMLRRASDRSLILIDEFGSGTEPAIGGALAEAVLNQFVEKGAWAVITTHYHNLKQYADTHEGKGVVNGAMLYDRKEMKPLFQLSIGRPGSSFAIEIARKIGLPEEVIREASDIVGQDYIQSDKYLQDIVRDKRYWENKRQTIHQREKDMEKTLQRYEDDIKNIEDKRKAIIADAKQKAEQLLSESNKRIERAIKEIKESQAEKEATKRIRKDLDDFKADVADIDAKASDAVIQKEMEKIRQRKQRKQQNKSRRDREQREAAEALRAVAQRKAADVSHVLQPGDHVRIKGLSSIGVLESIDGQMCMAVFGDMKTKMRLNRLEYVNPADEPKREDSSKSHNEALMESLGAAPVSHVTRETIDDHSKNFHQDIDVRGMRGEEALQTVQDFLDDAYLMGVPRVRILHGKGNGILRQLIRQRLSHEPHVSHFQDEHVQFGGTGITVVDLD